MFDGITSQIQDPVKKTTTNHNSLLNHKTAIVQIQDEFKIWKNAQQSLENKVEGIDKHVRKLPTRNELEAHMNAMDSTLVKIQEVSTGLTTHMDQYKLSESTSHKPRSEQAGPSTTWVYPELEDEDD